MALILDYLRLTDTWSEVFQKINSNFSKIEQNTGSTPSNGIRGLTGLPGKIGFRGNDGSRGLSDKLILIDGELLNNTEALLTWSAFYSRLYNYSIITKTELDTIGDIGINDIPASISEKIYRFVELVNTDEEIINIYNIDKNTSNTWLLSTITIDPNNISYVAEFGWEDKGVFVGINDSTTSEGQFIEEPPLSNTSLWDNDPTAPFPNLKLLTPKQTLRNLAILNIALTQGNTKIEPVDGASNTVTFNIPIKYIFKAETFSNIPNTTNNNNFYNNIRDYQHNVILTNSIQSEDVTNGLDNTGYTPIIALGSINKSVSLNSSLEPDSGIDIKNLYERFFTIGIYNFSDAFYLRLGPTNSGARGTTFNSGIELYGDDIIISNKSLESSISLSASYNASNILTFKSKYLTNGTYEAIYDFIGTVKASKDLYIGNNSYIALNANKLRYVNTTESHLFTIKIGAVLNNILEIVQDKVVAYKPINGTSAVFTGNISAVNITVSGVVTASGSNSTNWTSAYNERRQWDGGATNLVAATGRTSLDVAQKQSSLGDGTAGRGLIVGGFGIGGNALYITWNNTSPKTAFIYSNSGTVPVNATSYIGIKIVGNSNYIFDIAGRNNNAYIRTRENGVDGQWLKLAHTGNTLILGTNVAIARETLGLGTAAVLDAQTSTTDNTSGRLLIVGAFGLGTINPPSAITNISNVNKASSFYKAASNIGGLPSGGTTNGGMGLVMAQNASNTTILYSNPTSDRIWFMNILNNTQKSWYELYTTLNANKRTVDWSARYLHAAKIVAGAESTPNYIIDIVGNYNYNENLFRVGIEGAGDGLTITSEVGNTYLYKFSNGVIEPGTNGDINLGSSDKIFGRVYSNYLYLKPTPTSTTSGIYFVNLFGATGGYIKNIYTNGVLSWTEINNTARFDADGAASLNYKGSTKFKTNNGGVEVVGRLTASSTITGTNFILSSDRTVKENIADINKSVRDITFKQFNYIGDSRLRYGAIAQEVMVNHPEFVYKDGNNKLQLAYIDILIAKVAELEKENTEIKDRLQKLEK